MNGAHFEIKRTSSIVSRVKLSIVDAFDFSSIHLEIHCS